VASAFRRKNRHLAQNEAMPFSPGDRVLVAVLGKGIVREVRNGGRYLVEVKGRAVVVADGQMSAVDDGRGRRSAKAAPPVWTDVAVEPEGRHSGRSLDLHGRTTAEAVEELDRFLNDALLAGLTEVRIIHGRSGGRLRAAVHLRLRELGAARNFRLDPANPGVTIVTF
jgi:DNA mismatch repair protein MutS2